MKIEWLGHASFAVTSRDGTKIITDPYESGMRGMINYGPIAQSADVVTVSHEHGDHNYVAAVSGNPAVVKGAGITMVKGIEFNGIATYHDSVQGSQRGSNTVFVFAVDGIRIAHLGDLGHVLLAEQLEQLAGVEILLAPTGGPAATLELQDVIDTWEKIKPRIVIPMHFRTARCTFPRYGADDIVSLRPEARQAGSCELSFFKGYLPASTQVLILDPAR